MNAAYQKRWMQTAWPLGQCAALACCLEAAAPKAGNVYPSADFVDMDFTDFVVGGLAIGDVFENVSHKSVGQLVLDAVTAMRQRLNVNTHLGAILLMAPLAKAMALHEHAQSTGQATGHSTDASAGAFDLHASIGRVLEELSMDDTRLVYEAIRLARPGGLGRTDQHDVHGSDSPSQSIDLRNAMAKVADFDAVARQYVNNFHDVCQRMVVWLRRGMLRGQSILDAITEVQLRWLADELDGLIIRKSGHEVAEEARQLSSIALDEWLETGERGIRWHALDSFLRADGNSRNPGTTADLIAAALFVLLARPTPGTT